MIAPIIHIMQFLIFILVEYFDYLKEISFRDINFRVVIFAVPNFAIIRAWIYFRGW